MVRSIYTLRKCVFLENWFKAGHLSATKSFGWGEEGQETNLDGLDAQEYVPSKKYAARILDLQNKLDEDNYDMHSKVELGRIYADDGNYELSIETTKAALNGALIIIKRMVRWERLTICCGKNTVITII